MKMVCLMPTYGRRADLLNNSLACFASQTHPDKTLLIYDDLGTLQNTRCELENVVIMSTAQRSANVGEKYNEMLCAAIDVYGLQFDAVAVWDDDDVYLPMALENHAKTLQQGGWSKPSRILSAYFNPLKEEPANGRFHGSIAVHRDLVERCPWISTTRATFDQEYLSELSAIARPVDTLDFGTPQYVYRWQTSRAGHCSGLMGSPTWYADYKPDSRIEIDHIAPEFDADTVRILRLTNSFTHATSQFVAV